MFLNMFKEFISSQLFANIILLVTAVVALVVGLNQVRINDVIELYVVSGTKLGLNNIQIPVFYIQNIGTRVVYLDKYIFNGKEYKTNGQVLPPSYSQKEAVYWVELPRNGETHVSLNIYYHDLDGRKWKSEAIGDVVDGFWNISTFSRSEQ
jgi:hypothetical protein